MEGPLSPPSSNNSSSSNSSSSSPALFTPEDEQLLFSVMNSNIPVEQGNFWFPAIHSDKLPSLDSMIGIIFKFHFYFNLLFLLHLHFYLFIFLFRIRCYNKQ